MDKLHIRVEHIFEDGTRGFYSDFELPVESSVQSRDFLKQIKQFLYSDKLSEVGDASTDDLAAIFMVTPNTIVNWVRRDGMPMVIKTSKGYRFNKNDVFEWVKNHKAHYIYLINRYLDRKKTDGSQN